MFPRIIILKVKRCFHNSFSNENFAHDKSISLAPHDSRMAAIFIWANLTCQNAAAAAAPICLMYGS